MSNDTTSLFGEKKSMLILQRRDALEPKNDPLDEAAISGDSFNFTTK